jgi:hypothetical protein
MNQCIKRNFCFLNEHILHVYINHDYIHMNMIRNLNSNILMISFLMRSNFDIILEKQSNISIS